MKSTKMKKLLVLTLALVMVLAMSAAAFGTTGNGYYYVGANSSTDNPIDVKVIIESRQYSETDDTYISDALDVHITTPSNAKSGFTVRDAMLKASADYGYDLYTRQGNDILPFTANSTYIFSIEKDGKTYAPALPFPDPSYALDGWMFKVNGKIPLMNVSGELMGTGVADTPIHDGDIIHFHWDYPFQEDANLYYSAKFITADETYNNGNLSIQLKNSYNWFDNSSHWNILPYVNYAPGVSKTAYVYTGNNQLVTTVKLNPYGYGNKNVNLTSGVKYYVKVNTKKFKDIDDFETGATFHVIDTTMVYDKFVA